MSIAALLMALVARGVRMRVEGDRVKLHGCGKRLSEADLAPLRARSSSGARAYVGRRWTLGLDLPRFCGEVRAWD